jgi:hypothetical protein
VPRTGRPITNIARCHPDRKHRAKGLCQPCYDNARIQHPKKCPHGKRKTYCAPCGGKSMCEHGKTRHRCKQCGGRLICPHDRVRYNCRECKGGSICAHNKLRGGCIECRPVAVYLDYKQSAKSRGIPFEISFEQFMEIVMLPCFYCGVEPSHGVDRLVNDHEIGYTDWNSVPCCTIDNRMKWHNSEIEFLAQVTKIYEYRRLHG